MTPHGRLRLFVNTSRPPYVMLHSTSGVVVVNGATPAETGALFDELSKVAH